ncbi:phosphoribosylamine--glycine ligase [Spirochaetia bacterium]|nr:phosphoribosylamine--glycine ligase [Spirochaetia bacterium]GHU93894.1 phosphoribosylamine--glycine ligase [Spirochaetia bacterium]
MKILVIGSGGREHAIAWKLAQSEKVERIYAAPGNGGTALGEKCENLPPGKSPASEEGQNSLIQFVRQEKIDLAVVGPEDPLAAGIVDRFRDAGLAIIGPDQKAARLEASKVYSKAFMKKYGVRAAESRDFSDPAAALAYAQKHFDGDRNSNTPIAPLVIKADGLAAGKGVVIAENFAEADKALSSFMKDKSLGTAGASVVLEDFLVGKEVSVLAAVSVSPGKKGCIRPFVSARDHKRRFEAGKGPNTGGMGAIAPAPDFTPEAQEDFVRSILEPTLRGIEVENMDYRGFIFFGLMVHQNCCSLLEYNVRLGDPETQAVLPLMDADFSELCLSILEGSLNAFPLKWKSGAVCAPVIVAEGYPGAYHKGDSITINEKGFVKTGAQLFIAGAQRDSGGASDAELRTSGGRVLAVSAWGGNADEAWTRAYEAMGFISFEGMAYRKDIGREGNV